MKTPEDEAFDDLARRQGMWGGGFPAKRQMAADKLQDGKCKYCVDGCIACDARAQPAHCQCPACKDGVLHASDCAVHNGPAYPAGPCDCGVAQEPVVCERCKQLEEQAYDLLGQLKVANLKWSVAHPWVGLTDEDRKAVLLTAYKEWECEELLLCAREDYLLIEQALKEKNG